MASFTVQGKSKLREGGIKLGFPLDCHYNVVYLEFKLLLKSCILSCGKT